jgi:hypothetical protein
MLSSLQRLFSSQPLGSALARRVRLSCHESTGRLHESTAIVTVMVADPIRQGIVRPIFVAALGCDIEVIVVPRNHFLGQIVQWATENDILVPQRRGLGKSWAAMDPA